MPHVCDHEGTILYAKIGVREEGQNSHNLILVTKGCDQWAYRTTPSEIMEQLQFILDSDWTAGHIDLL